MNVWCGFALNGLVLTVITVVLLVSYWMLLATFLVCVSSCQISRTYGLIAASQLAGKFPEREVMMSFREALQHAEEAHDLKLKVSACDVLCLATAQLESLLIIWVKFQLVRKRERRLQCWLGDYVCLQPNVFRWAWLVAVSLILVTNQLGSSKIDTEHTTCN